MTGTEDGSGSSGTPDDKRRRPKPPVLDLKATELENARPAEAPTSEPAAESAPAAETGSDQAADAALPPDLPTADPVPFPPSDIPPGADASPPGPEPTDAAGLNDADAPLARSRRSGWGIAGLAIGAGAGAAAGAAALLAVAWILGLPLGRDERVAETAKRTAALQARIEEVAGRPQPGPDPRIEEVMKQLAAMQQALDQVKGLEPRLTQAEAALARVRSTGDANLAERVGTIDETIKSLAASVANLNGRLDEIAATAKAAQDAAARSSGAASAASADVTGEIAKLGQRLMALEQATKTLQAAAQAATPDRDRAARLAAVSLALRAAVESGAPFAAELAVAKALAPDPARLSPLDPFAAGGVPSSAALERELASLVESARRAASSAAASTGILDWLQANLSRLVRVRTVDGPVQSGDAIGRVQAVAARGDIGAAVAEAEKLPDVTRAPLEPWIRRAKGRIAAIEAARAFARDGLVALAASGEPASR